MEPNAQWSIRPWPHLPTRWRSLRAPLGLHCAVSVACRDRKEIVEVLQVCFGCIWESRSSLKLIHIDVVLKGSGVMARWGQENVKRSTDLVCLFLSVSAHLHAVKGGEEESCTLRPQCALPDGKVSSVRNSSNVVSQCFYLSICVNNTNIEYLYI